MTWHDLQNKFERMPCGDESAPKKGILFDTRPMDCDDLEAAEEQMLDKLGR